MGLFGWLVPSAEKKVAKARKLIDEQRYAEARLLLLGLNDDTARAALVEARQGLVRINLDGAQAWCHSGDEAQVADHLERAANFDPGGMAGEIEEARVKLDAIRRRRDHGRLWRDLQDAAERRSRLGIDPSDPAWVARNTGAIQLANAEKDPNGLPHLAFYPEPAIYEPPGIKAPAGKAPTSAEIESALVALKAMYPADLTAKIGATHAEAVLQVAANHPERAVALLMPIREGDAVAHFELARAACCLGNPEVADFAFGLFAELAGGYRTVGDVHAADIHAQVIASLGETGRALALLDEQRQKTPHLAPILFAALAVERGRLAQAATVVASLRRNSGRDPRLPPIVTMLTLRETVAELAKTHPILRGVVPQDEQEEMRQRGVVADAISAAVEKAIQGLGDEG